MKNSLLISLSTILMASTSLADNAVREWTNTEGRTISASLVELKGEAATLRLDDGRKFIVELSTLSEEDNAYAAAWLAEQETSATAVAMGLKLGAPGEVIIESPFDEDMPRTRKADLSGWKAGIGEWRVEDGALIGDEVAEDNHASSLTQHFEADHLIIQAEVQLGTASQIAIACRDTVPPNLHLGRLYLEPGKIWIQKMTGISKTTKAEKLVTKEVELDPEAWYPVTIEIVGETYRATVGDVEIEAQHERFADAKGIVALVNRGKGAKFRNVTLWKAEPAE